jgi:hypothetical protein
MNQEHTEALARVSERIRGFDEACNEREYTDVGDAWEILYAAREAIDNAVGAKTPNGPYYGCEACGCTDIEYQCWVELNTGKPTDDCGSLNVWCPQCDDAESRSVEVDRLKPYDPSERGGIPEGA